MVRSVEGKVYWGCWPRRRGKILGSRSVIGSSPQFTSYGLVDGGVLDTIIEEKASCRGPLFHNRRYSILRTSILPVPFVPKSWTTDVIPTPGILLNADLFANDWISILFPLPLVQTCPLVCSSCSSRVNILASSRLRSPGRKNGFLRSMKWSLSAPLRKRAL